MTTVALISKSLDLGFLQPIFHQLDAALKVAVWPDPACLEAEIAACWDPPPGVFALMPRLQLIHGIAAGVDNVLQGQDLCGRPVCRIVDPLLAEGMFQYVLWGVLHFHRQLDVAMANQRDRVWSRPPQVAARSFRVGIMGLGALGGLIAGRLSQLDYAVSGWARTRREIPGVSVHAGASELPDFLGGVDVLVCLLPLTAQTRGMLNLDTFRLLPRGAGLIQCGRGEHLVEEDLLAALDDGQLRGAIVDVFSQEPLPASHPLWRHPRVTVTPHMASMASFEAVVGQIISNIGRLQAGAPLRHRVDLERGY